MNSLTLNDLGGRKKPKWLKRVQKVSGKLITPIAIIAGGIMTGGAVLPLLAKAATSLAPGIAKSQNISLTNALPQAIAKVAEMAVERKNIEQALPPAIEKVSEVAAKEIVKKKQEGEVIIPEAKAGLPKWAIPVGIGATILIVGVMLLKKK